VDNAGFVLVKKRAILEDLKQGSFSFEASAHLSLSLKELYEELSARIIFLVRDPMAVVRSYLRKGWYSDPITRTDTAIAPFFQKENPLPSEMWHFWGRLLPTDEVAQSWDELSRAAKLGWYWQNLNQRVLEQLKEIPPSHHMTVKLEEFDYECYLNIVSFLQLERALPQNEFERIAAERPNKSSAVSIAEEWGTKEKEEAMRFVKPVAQVLGYRVCNGGFNPQQVAETRSSKSPKKSLGDNLRKLKKIYLNFILSEFRKHFYR